MATVLKEVDGIDLENAAEANVDGNVEHIVVEGGGGKTTPFAGIGKEGSPAVPKTVPLPGKLPDVEAEEDFSAVTEAAAADLAWCSAALSLSRDCRAGPRRRFVW